MDSDDSSRQAAAELGTSAWLDSCPSFRDGLMLSSVEDRNDIPSPASHSGILILAAVPGQGRTNILGEGTSPLLKDLPLVRRPSPHQPSPGPCVAKAITGVGGKWRGRELCVLNPQAEVGSEISGRALSSPPSPITWFPSSSAPPCHCSCPKPCSGEHEWQQGY